METLLAELNSIPNEYKAQQHNDIITITENEFYEDKKHRFVKLLQLVNPNLKIQYADDKNKVISQLLIDNKIKVDVYMYTNSNNECWLHQKDLAYFIKLEVKHCTYKSDYKFNHLKCNKAYPGFYDGFYYDSKYVEDVLSCYYTKDEFIEKAPNELCIKLPRALLYLIYSFTTSSLMFFLKKLT